MQYTHSQCTKDFRNLKILCMLNTYLRMKTIANSYKKTVLIYLHINIYVCKVYVNTKNQRWNADHKKADVKHKSILKSMSWNSHVSSPPNPLSRKKILKDSCTKSMCSEILPSVDTQHLLNQDKLKKTQRVNHSFCAPVVNNIILSSANQHFSST